MLGSPELFIQDQDMINVLAIHTMLASAHGEFKWKGKACSFATSDMFKKKAAGPESTSFPVKPPAPRPLRI